MGMDSVDVKGDDRNVRVFVVKGKTFDSGELRERIIIQFSAMGFDVLKSDFFQKSIALPNPIASAIGGVPASKQ